MEEQPLQNLKAKLDIQNRLLIKDAYFGLSIGDETHPKDDFFLLASQGIQNFKVCKIEVYKGSYDQVAAIRFTYKKYLNNENDTKTIIQGNMIGYQQADIQFQKEKKVFNLEDDEFLVKVTPFIEVAIDQITFVTSKNVGFHAGSRNQGSTFPIEFKSPENFHYNCFSGMYSPHWEGVSLLNADIYSQQKYEVDNQLRILFQLQAQPILSVIVCFLTTKDISRFIRSKNIIYQYFKNNYICIDEIGRRALFSGSRNLIEYYTFLKNQSSLSKTAFNDFKIYEHNLYNYVENPHGEQGLKGFTCIQGDKQVNEDQAIGEDKGLDIQYLNGLSHFKFSYFSTKIIWNHDLIEIFSPKNIQMIENSELAIIFGIEIADSNYGGTLSAEVIISDQNDKQIFKKIRKFEKIQRGFKFYNIAGYIKSKQANSPNPNHIKFSITGKDSRQWRGHFGPRLRSIACRLVPVSDKEIRYFNYSFRDYK